MKRLCFIFSLFSAVLSAADLQIIVAPRVSVVEREGITGGGQIVSAGDRLLMFYPNHPDDFGGSGGMGASVSEDGGATWKAQPDDWPMPKMVDLWADKLRDGSLLAFGIRWVPDPKKRGEVTAKDVPADAYQIAVSKDQGRTWQPETAVIECPPEFGVIARPLPHAFEDEKGALFMPAYAWGKHGNHALLLTSADRGRRWTVLSSITTAAAMVKAGAPVTTPWLETTVSPTKGGDWLAIVRTGSSAKASLVSVRSADRGKTWSAPEKLPIAGKLPTLQLLPNGVLALLTAHSKNHARLYLSADGTGREWSQAYILTSLCGGNAGMTVTGKDSLIVITPANRRIDAWRVKIGAPSVMTKDLAAPTGIAFAKGVLSWSGSAAGYRVTPVLMKTPTGYDDTEIHPHAIIQTATTQLDLSRQLLIGGSYRFEISAMDREGRASAATGSAEFVMKP
ncbi:MAG TPA: sialidase family protein [Prosthecobacter sp.]|nr:sialidase family protein [Prosthecobacter sp.]